MRINGHTRLDLYSSCTALQVTLKNSHSYTGSPLKKTQIPVNILPRTVRTSRSDQNVALRMRINGHTRLDLYSSCTAVQLTLRNSHSYTGSPLKKLKFQLTYFPGLYRLAVWTKTQLSGWESMDIPDLTCTVLVRPVQVTLNNSHSYTGSPLKKLKFQLTYFPGLYRLAVWTKRQLSGWESMDIPDLTCTVLVRPYRWPWRIHIAIQDLHWKNSNSS